MNTDASEILEIIEILSPEDSPMPFPILELFCRSAGKDYDDKVIRSFMGNEKYYPHLENPEYYEKLVSERFIFTIQALKKWM